MSRPIADFQAVVPIRGRKPADRSYIHGGTGMCDRCNEQKRKNRMSRNGEALASEPKLEEVLSDPIVHLIMKRDGLTPDRVMAEVMPVARHLIAQRLSSAAIEVA